VNSDYGESSIISMLTRWPHFTLTLEGDCLSGDTWSILEEHLPMWICDWEKDFNEQAKAESESDRSELGSTIVMGKFSSCYPHHDIHPIPHSLLQRSVSCPLQAPGKMIKFFLSFLASM